MPIESSLFRVYEAKRPEQNLLVHDVQLLDYHWKLDELVDPMSIIVVSKLTEQRIKVQVRTPSTFETFSRSVCQVSKHSPLVTLLYNYRNALTIIGSMVVIFAVTFYGKEIILLFTH